MSTMYRIMGPYVRPIGEHLADGEYVHPCALERRNAKELGYDPPNLREALARNPPIGVAQTKRGQGKACEEVEAEAT
jgi:hypothetical protein